MAASSAIDETAKNHYWAVGHYDTDEEQAVVIGLLSSSTENRLFIGGYNVGGNTATSIELYTAANNTTTVGTERMRIESDGDVRIGGTEFSDPSAQLHIDQDSSSGAQPVLYLDQADVSEEFIRFVGTAAAGTLTQSIVNEGDQGSETREGWLKVYVQDDGNQITDQSYYIPIYSLSA